MAIDVDIRYIITLLSLSPFDVFIRWNFAKKTLVFSPSKELFDVEVCFVECIRKTLQIKISRDHKYHKYHWNCHVSNDQ